MQYKIKWMSKVTEFSGEGSIKFDKATAKKIADTLNNSPESNKSCTYIIVKAQQK